MGPKSIENVENFRKKDNLRSVNAILGLFDLTLLQSKYERFAMIQPASEALDTSLKSSLTGKPADELEDLIYLISHDLRASLRALLEVPQWIEEDLYDLGQTLPESLTENIAMMNTHTKRLDRMLCDLLVFSRVGRMQRRVDINLDAVLCDLVEALPVPNDVKIDWKLEWQGLNIGERDIVTLLSALIGNSIKHRDSGMSRILIETLWEDGQPVLYVSDDGVGIEPKYNEIIFDVMQTLQPREEVEGSGMGLSIARKVVALYDGSIRLDSPRLNRGTTMRVRFRLVN